MKRWEYLFAGPIRSRKDDDPTLNSLGADGWECYFIDAGMHNSRIFYMKREVPSAQGDRISKRSKDEGKKG